MNLNKNWFFALLYLIFIFILSSIPGDDINKVSFINIPYFDKIVHFSLYFIFTYFIYIAVINDRGIVYNKYIIVFILLLFSAFFDEVHQLFTPHRSFDLFDILADIIGCIIFLITTRFFKYKALF